MEGARSGGGRNLASGEQDWDSAVESFERGFLENLYPQYPSSRKLAARLKTSHSMIANKLRKYRIGKD